MHEKPPEKSTKGRKNLSADDKKITIRPSIPTAQKVLVERLVAITGSTVSQFVEDALKDLIYKTALEKPDLIAKCASDAPQSEPMMLPLKVVNTKKANGTNGK